MKKLICLLIVLLPTLALADDIDVAVKYQLQLAKLSREREQAPIVETPKKRTFDEAYQLAVKTAKPLVVWLGDAICPACIESTNDEFVHFADAAREGFPANSITVYMRKGSGPNLSLVGYVKGWKDDGKHGHLPTIRKILRKHDDTGLVIHEVIAWEESRPLLPPITHQFQMQSWSQPMYQPRMVAPVRFMSGGRACVT